MIHKKLAPLSESHKCLEPKGGPGLVGNTVPQSGLTRRKKRGKQRDKTKGKEGRQDRPEPAKRASPTRPQQGGKEK